MTLEVPGSLGKSSEIFITRLCKMLCRSLDDQRAGSFLKQRISMALQICNAACVLVLPRPPFEKCINCLSIRDTFQCVYHVFQMKPLSDVMDLRHQSIARCITMLVGEDTHPWSATKVGNPIPATIASIPEDR